MDEVTPLVRNGVGFEFRQDNPHSSPYPIVDPMRNFELLYQLRVS
jgi:hypothetical protein